MEVDFASQTTGTGTLLGSLRVAIVGLGLMGGSLAMALRGRCHELIGIDSDPETLKLAAQKRVADCYAEDLWTVLPRVDLVILSAPACAILSLLADPQFATARSCMVFDIGSTKAQIVTAMNRLPDSFDPLGMHPICGKERNGLAFAEAGLYRDAPLVLSPLPRTTHRALSIAEEIAAAIGAKALRMDAVEHDRQIAATSHLPYLLSSALSLATPPEAAPLAGPGFRSSSRLATSSPRMMLDILKTNRENVLSALGRFRQALDRLENAINGEDWERLEEMLALSAAAREALVGSQAGETK